MDLAAREVCSGKYVIPDDFNESSESTCKKEKAKGHPPKFVRSKIKSKRPKTQSVLLLPITGTGTGTVRPAGPSSRR